MGFCMATSNAAKKITIVKAFYDNEPCDQSFEQFTDVTYHCRTII